MIRTHSGVSVIRLDFVHLDELVEHGFGVLHGPVPMYGRVDVHVLGVLHAFPVHIFHVLLSKIDIVLLTGALTGRLVGFAHALRAVTRLKYGSLG